MAKHVDTVETLKRYIEGVAGRADHHAGNVNEVIFPLIGALIWRHEIGSIKVRDQNGDIKNALWIIIGTKRYYLAYNHTNSCIDIKQDNSKGSVLGSFTNSTPLPDVINFFRKL